MSEMALHQLYQFAELGQLTASLLHDLANPLTAAQLSLEQFTHQPHVSPASDVYLQRLQLGLQQACFFVETARLQLLSMETHQELSVGSVWLTLTTLLQQRLTHLNIKLAYQATSCDLVLTPPGLVTRILLTLLTNAIDAVALVPAEQRRITLKYHRAQGYHVIQLCDTGPGISPEIKFHLFQPFRSTKPQGLGLGLYLAKHCAEQQLQGQLLLTSGHRHGTTITLKLPVQ